jgi:hypothetical protein
MREVRLVRKLPLAIVHCLLHQGRVTTVTVTVTVTRANLLHTRTDIDRSKRAYLCALQSHYH